MLFNSYIFILFFLPCTFAGFIAASRLRREFGLLWLFFASLVFYGWWDPRYVVLLVGSILFNYAIGRMLSDPERSAGSRRLLLIIGVGCDLGLLAVFKYTDFIIATANTLTGAGWRPTGIALPLGISFFTFTQIAFLADAYRSEVRELSFSRYGLFVSYFPHLIAGPVLHHAEMMPQFAQQKTWRPSVDNVAVGLTIFFIGLFKKVILADHVAVYVGPTFDHAAAPGLIEAWLASLAYTLQIYFDFSGYSDMAIGLSRLFGVILPLNFASPYKARNIIDFWRRWHMTLSRFLRDYLYIPLGGNRKGRVRRFVNVMVTMLLGGLWHGAGWTFVIWGGLHGAFLVVNHLWQMLRGRPEAIMSEGKAGAALAQLVTFICVVVAWVFFRAPSLDRAMTVLQGMTGLNGVVVPSWAGPSAIGWIASLMLIAFFCPNTQELLRDWRPALVLPPRLPGPLARLAWSPTVAWSLFTATAASWALLNLANRSEFLYFRF